MPPKEKESEKVKAKFPGRGGRGGPRVEQVVGAKMITALATRLFAGGAFPSQQHPPPKPKPASMRAQPYPKQLPLTSKATMQAFSPRCAAGENENEAAYMSEDVDPYAYMLEENSSNWTSDSCSPSEDDAMMVSLRPPSRASSSQADSDEEEDEREAAELQPTHPSSSSSQTAQPIVPIAIPAAGVKRPAPPQYLPPKHMRMGPHDDAKGQSKGDISLAAAIAYYDEAKGQGN